MFHVLCTLPHASALINGVAFVATDDGMLSEPVEQSVAEAFAQIPGYTAVAIQAQGSGTQPEGGAPQGTPPATSGGGEAAPQQPSRTPRRRAA